MVYSKIKVTSVIIVAMWLFGCDSGGSESVKVDDGRFVTRYKSDDIQELN